MVEGETPSSLASCRWVLSAARSAFQAMYRSCQARMIVTCSSVSVRGRPIVLFMGAVLRDAGATACAARAARRSAAVKTRASRLAEHAAFGRAQGLDGENGVLALKAPEAVARACREPFEPTVQPPAEGSMKA